MSETDAREREPNRATTTKTWRFAAENVRDFGFATSRKFIWDAIGVPFGDRIVMAMSFYPKEANPLWEQYSTQAVAHTLRVYSKYTFDYPYPVAQSIHTNNIGMEYPMICFNGRRPEEDGTYSEQVKYGLISVIIHEVGHNFFPMIVNSDERQWTWMDEGLNTFLQYLTEQEWERGYPSRRGPAENIVDYMKGDRRRISPIMTNSDSVWQLGPNAYAKPTTALNILRETVMGRELFDFAFKEYAQRWMFKHPTPEDFFRMMEDASAVDLDWFWRGWFYTTEAVDVSLDSVEWFQVDTKDPDVETTFQREQDAQQPTNLSAQRNLEAIERTFVEQDEDLKDFYNAYDKFAGLDLDREDYDTYVATLDGKERELLGEFNWSSQHLDDEVLQCRDGHGEGQTGRVGLRCVRLVGRRQRGVRSSNGSGRRSRGGCRVRMPLCPVACRRPWVVVGSVRAVVCRRSAWRPDRLATCPLRSGKRSRSCELRAPGCVTLPVGSGEPRRLSRESYVATRRLGAAVWRIGRRLRSGTAPDVPSARRSPSWPRTIG